MWLLFKILFYKNYFSVIICHWSGPHKDPAYRLPGFCQSAPGYTLLSYERGTYWPTKCQNTEPIVLFKMFVRRIKFHSVTHPVHWALLLSTCFQRQKVQKELCAKHFGDYKQFQILALQHIPLSYFHYSMQFHILCT